MTSATTTKTTTAGSIWIDQSEASNKSIDQSEASLLTMIMHREAGQDGDAEAASGGEDGELVLGDRGLERGVPLRPVGDQLIEGPGLQTRPGEDVATHCRRLTNKMRV